MGGPEMRPKGAVGGEYKQQWFLDQNESTGVFINHEGNHVVLKRQKAPLDSDLVKRLQAVLSSTAAGSIAVPVMGQVTYKGNHYLETQYCTQGSLSSIDPSSLDVDEVGSQILDSIEFWHEEGLAHGNIKPANVMPCTKKVEDEKASLAVQFCDPDLNVILNPIWESVVHRDLKAALCTINWIKRYQEEGTEPRKFRVFKSAREIEGDFKCLNFGTALSDRISKILKQLDKIERPVPEQAQPPVHLSPEPEPAPRQSMKGPIDRQDQEGESVTDAAIEQKKSPLQQTPTIPSPKIDNKELHGILDLLGILKYYPQRLSQDDVDGFYGRKLNSMEDLVPVFLSHLMTLDSNARDELAQDAMLQKLKQITPDACTLHPLDIIVVLYLCTDDFLRGSLNEKLFACKLSLPLAIPSIVGPGKSDLLFFPLEGLVWQGTGMVHSLLTHETKVLSVARMGHPKLSKSELANELLGQGASTFTASCNMDQDIHTNISRGTIDAGWLLPQGDKGTNVSTQLSVILNLHGNAKDHPQHLKFLARVSDLLVIVISLEEFEKENGMEEDTIQKLRELNLDHNKFHLVLCNDGEENFGKKDITNAADLIEKTFGKNFAEPGLTTHFGREKIKANTLLAQLRLKIPGSSLKKRFNSLNDESTFIIDENQHQQMRSAKKSSSAVMEIIAKGGSIPQVKEQQLVHQGKLWREWTEMEKKGHRGKSGTDTDKKMDKLEDQRSSVAKEGYTKLLGRFQSSIVTDSNSELNIYLLFWVKLELNLLSRQKLPELNQRHCEIWQSLQQVKTSGTDSAERDKKAAIIQKEFNEADQDIASHSLGIEHLLRELGQIFMTSRLLKTTEDFATRSKMLPDIAAEMMFKGYPLEIMDGDASYVPLPWVESVFRAVARKVGLKNKIMILSIIGLQSSGKSTLLNAMFGLKFSVSAGRCTRGAYAQLVRTPEHQNYPFKYILVVDTEGLRAPELGSTSLVHDHEIATFVVGISDITLINIKGENRADFQNILQIVIEALLRMRVNNPTLKKLLNPSCMFIHQNVSARNASEMVVHSQRRLLDELNEMTRVSADNLKLEKEVKQFSDIIGFDISKHTLYFSDLLRGDPPMAPVNPGYAHDVSELKNIILNEGLEKGTGLCLDDIIRKTNDVWHGVLDENFVFSFRNAIEIRAYGALEQKISELTGEVDEVATRAALSWRQKIGAETNNIDKVVTEAHGDINLTLQTELHEAEAKLDAFIEEHRDKESMEQWRLKTKNKLQGEIEDIGQSKKRDFTQAGDWRKKFLEQNKDLTKFKNGMVASAIQLAQKLMKKNKSYDDILLKKKFDQIWEENTKEIEGAMPKKDIEKDVKNHYYKDDYNNMTTMNDSTWIKHSMTGQSVITAEHIIQKIWFESSSPQSWASNEPKDNPITVDQVKRGLQGVARKIRLNAAGGTPRCEQNLRSELDKMVQNVQAKIKELPIDAYDAHEGREVVRLIGSFKEPVTKQLETLSSSRDLLPRWMEVKVIMIKWSIHLLEKRQDIFIEKTNLRRRFKEENYDTTFKLFMSTYTNTEVKGAVDIIVDDWMDVIKEHIRDRALAGKFNTT